VAKQLHKSFHLTAGEVIMDCVEISLQTQKVSLSTCAGMRHYLCCFWKPCHLKSSSKLPGTSAQRPGTAFSRKSRIPFVMLGSASWRCVHLDRRRRKGTGSTLPLSCEDETTNWRRLCLSDWASDKWRRAKRKHWRLCRLKGHQGKTTSPLLSSTLPLQNIQHLKNLTI